MSEKKKLLIVEDNPDIASITALVLQKQYEVFIAPNADSALALLEKHGVDFILMDMFLGAGETGVDLTRRLRSIDRFKNIPIVAHTANAMGGHKLEAIEAGMNDYIAKPYRIKDLEEMVARWI